MSKKFTYLPRQNVYQQFFKSKKIPLHKVAKELNLSYCYVSGILNSIQVCNPEIETRLKQLVLKYKSEVV
jgi:hypothetical protein